MKKPPLFQISEPITIEQWSILLHLLAQCEAEPSERPLTFLKYLTAYYYVDITMANYDRNDLATMILYGVEGVDRDEIVYGLPIRLVEEFEGWVTFDDVVQGVNDFLEWAWDRFIEWEV